MKQRSRVILLLVVLVSILTSIGIKLNTKAGVPIPEFPKQPPQYPLYDKANINKEEEWHISNTHDPSVYKDGDTYYVFSTDFKVGENLRPVRPGIMVRKSKDLIHWDWLGYALDGVPKEAGQWTGADRLWAPDVMKIGDIYFLYYAASKFGTNQSFIGVATSKSITGPWTDQGEVYKTTKGNASNAIDPNPVFDEKGEPWMVYGSFFGGIYISKLNPATGKLADYGEGKLLARRDGLTVQGAVEGPYIVYQPEFKKYYLFVSYDSLFSDYHVRVGRSDQITGPYLDFNDNVLTNTAISPQSQVGNKVIGSYRFSQSEGWMAPGHNSILQDGKDYFMVHHARGETDTKWAYLQVRKLLWTREGWPVVSPERYAGETVQSIPRTMLAGDWDRLVFKQAEAGKSTSSIISLLPNGNAESNTSTGHWSFEQPNKLILSWNATDSNPSSVDTVMVMPSWDWEKNKPTLVFTGMNEKGLSIWGKYVDLHLTIVEKHSGQ
jgi:arabinan endo-1,5-alpha-L-arabinosidase